MAARAGAALFWVVAGVMHFVIPRQYEAIVPPSMARWKKEVVVVSGLVDHLETLNTANRASTLANLTETSGELVGDLQDERATAVLMLAPNTAPATRRTSGVSPRATPATMPSAM